MTQSRALSLVESAANVLVGYALAVIMQIVLFPLFGWNLKLTQNLRIGLVFAGVSLARGYLLRRLFERLRIRIVDRRNAVRWRADVRRVRLIGRYGYRPSDRSFQKYERVIRKWPLQQPGLAPVP